MATKIIENRRETFESPLRAPLNIRMTHTVLKLRPWETFLPLIVWAYLVSLFVVVSFLW